jgi:hypothetical protein
MIAADQSRRELSKFVSNPPCSDNRRVTGEDTLINNFQAIENALLGKDVACDEVTFSREQSQRVRRSSHGPAIVGEVVHGQNRTDSFPGP